MIRAIIFDCFGVITEDGWLAFCQRYFSQDPALLEQANRLNHQTDRGERSFDDLVRVVSGMAGVLPEDTLQQIGIHPPDAALLAYIGSLKPNYRIGMLSNAATNWLSDLLSPAELSLFDAIILSYELGVIKPDPKMYQAIVAKLAVEPEQCIYVDDRQLCIDGAEQRGMRPILYHDFAQFKTDLGALISADS